MYDMSFGPLLRTINRPLAVINRTIVSKYLEALLPNMTAEDRRDPSISPFFADLYSMKLPPALFLCGTEDCLLEDTVLMAARYGNFSDAFPSFQDIFPKQIDTTSSPQMPRRDLLLPQSFTLR